MLDLNPPDFINQMVTVTLYARHGAEHIRPCQLDSIKTERGIEVDDIIIITKAFIQLPGWSLYSLLLHYLDNSRLLCYLNFC